MHTKFVGMHFFLYFCGGFCARVCCALVRMIIVKNIDETIFSLFDGLNGLGISRLSSRKQVRVFA